jgi:quinol monooxygenase YgiN
MSEQFALIVEFKAAPGKRDELKSELLALVSPTRKELGCIRYDLHQSVESPDDFTFYEVWASRAALAAHDASSHVTHARTVIPELVGENKVRKVFLGLIEPCA